MIASFEGVYSFRASVSPLVVEVGEDLKYLAQYAGVLMYILGGMYMASLFEDRATAWSLWEDQYRALFPGDLGLALALVAGYGLAGSMKTALSGWARVAAVLVGLAVGVCLFIWQISPEEVEQGLRFAPTRIWHQIFVWGGLTAATLVYALPGVWQAIRSFDRVYGLQLGLIAAGLFVWVGCAVWDARRGQFLDPAHPVHAPWKPIFQEVWRRLMGLRG